MTRFFLSKFPTFFRLGDLSKAIWQWISEAERAKRWASERAAIKAEVNLGKGNRGFAPHGLGNHTS